MKKLLNQKELKEKEYEKLLKKKKIIEFESEDQSEIKKLSNLKPLKNKINNIIEDSENSDRDEYSEESGSLDDLEVYEREDNSQDDKKICLNSDGIKLIDKKLKVLSFTQMLDQFSKDDLQNILKCKNLPISGNKDELIARLRVSLKNVKKK